MRTRGDGALFRRANGLWVARVELPMTADRKRRTKSVSSMDRNEAVRRRGRPAGPPRYSWVPGRVSCSGCNGREST